MTQEVDFCAEEPGLGVRIAGDILVIHNPKSVRAIAEQLSQDLAGDPKHIYKHKIRQESTPSRGF